MMYLNDLSSALGTFVGGETAFPNAKVVGGGKRKGLYIEPRKGSAVFWYNVLPRTGSSNGDADADADADANADSNRMEMDNPSVVASTKWRVDPLSVHSGQRLVQPPPPRDASGHVLRALHPAPRAVEKWTATKWLRQSTHRLNFAQ